MIRFTSLALLAACAGTPARPAKTEPVVVTNQLAITRFQLPPTRVPSMEGRHSSQHSNTTLSGSLEIIGTGDHTTARLTLDSTTQTSYVLCRGETAERWPPRQACIPRSQLSADAGKPRHGTLVLDGAATWSGEALIVDVSKELQPDPASAPYTVRIVLACSEDADGLACQIKDTERMFAFEQIGALKFTRAKHPAPPRMQQHGPQAARVAQSL